MCTRSALELGRNIVAGTHPGDWNVVRGTLLLIIQTNLSRVVVVELVASRQADARPRSLNLLIHARASIGRTERIVAEETQPEGPRDDEGAYLKPCKALKTRANSRSVREISAKHPSSSRRVRKSGDFPAYGDSEKARASSSGRACSGETMRKHIASHPAVSHPATS
ncbi:hypothetical protein DMN91_009346 [Ooceraea biroi]|uniref:Uncharacterized protein n=1 Tax=Ooceraea biroi TaxID=2015173 RepID=A0A3L8DGG5_OOCBI|nr:uncharacterized protein LOC113562502 [Ooceraea biroi]RLU18988.1 hypothetical protein DMN91_009346 [Ooceraea biroi]